jgi:hypothetical protein
MRKITTFLRAYSAWTNGVAHTCIGITLKTNTLISPATWYWAKRQGTAANPQSSEGVYNIPFFLTQLTHHAGISHGYLKHISDVARDIARALALISHERLYRVGYYRYVCPILFSRLSILLFVSVHSSFRVCPFLFSRLSFPCVVSFLDLTCLVPVISPSPIC